MAIQSSTTQLHNYNGYVKLTCNSQAAHIITLESLLCIPIHRRVDPLKASID